MEHGSFFYLASWATPLIFSVIALFALPRISFLKKKIDRSEAERNASLPRFFRLGGSVLMLVFLVMLWGDSRLIWDAPLIALTVGTLSIFFFALSDDFAPVSWPWHLLLQVGLGCLAFAAGMRIDLSAYLTPFLAVVPPFLGFVAVVIWIVLIMNALNWSDGADGLMPGIVAIASGTIFILSLRPEVNQPTVGILSLILLALALGLLFFNWHPARIWSGTGGAYFFGFSLAILAIYAGTKVATLLVVLAIPVLDALLVCLRRLENKRSLFLPDQEHMHYRLAGLGWGVRRIVLSYLGITGVMAILALSFREFGKIAVFLLAAVFLLSISVALSVWATLKKKMV